MKHFLGGGESSTEVAQTMYAHVSKYKNDQKGGREKDREGGREGGRRKEGRKKGRKEGNIFGCDKY
jgi:hypothetical protein